MLEEATTARVEGTRGGVIPRIWEYREGFAATGVAAMEEGLLQLELE